MSFRAKRVARSRGICIFLLCTLAACTGDPSARKLTADTVSVATEVASAPEMPGIPPVFDSIQAKRGQKVYFSECLRCHTGDRFVGPQFTTVWKTRRVYDLYDIVASTMPQDAPGNLSPDQYVDVVAFMLQVNGAKPGTSKLTNDSESLKKMRIGLTSAAGDK